jgi:SHS2 domain-containing protein
MAKADDHGQHIPHHETPKRIAVRITGNSQADLFVNSGCALFDVMADVGKIEVKERLPLEVEAADRDELIVNWLRELLYLYQGGVTCSKSLKLPK